MCARALIHSPEPRRGCCMCLLPAMLPTMLAAMKQATTACRASCSASPQQAAAASASGAVKPEGLLLASAGCTHQPSVLLRCCSNAAGCSAACVLAASPDCCPQCGWLQPSPCTGSLTTLLLPMRLAAAQPEQWQPHHVATAAAGAEAGACGQQQRGQEPPWPAASAPRQRRPRGRSC